jgi:regulator of sirC expression with transglutaminase-like and TPR domain
MLMMAVVLTEDFGVRYNPAKAMNAAQAYTGDEFFADSRDVFLHGLTGERRLGTCSSLPVLHVAVGQRLGYPLKLVATKGHLFLRWEDERDRFKVEFTGQGVNRFQDDYYRRWPVAVTDAEVRSEGYLKSMAPAEELAAFLSIRGLCWQEAGNARLAAESFPEAARLAPEVRSYQMMLARLEPMPSGE